MKVNYILAIAISLSACSKVNVTPKQATTATSMVAGGMIGSTFSSGSGQTVSIIGGALLAKHVIEQLTQKLDDNDKTYLYNAQLKAFTSNIGEPIYWKNLNSGNRGILTPTEEKYSQSGQLCREFKHQIFMNWRSINTTGAACKLDNQDWRIVR